MPEAAAKAAMAALPLNHIFLILLSILTSREKRRFAFLMKRHSRSRGSRRPKLIMQYDIYKGKIGHCHRQVITFPTRRERPTSSGMANLYQTFPDCEPGDPAESAIAYFECRSKAAVPRQGGTLLPLHALASKPAEPGEPRI
jgi:hypothetical protein